MAISAANNVKYVTLRDPKTNDILVPRMIGSLGYEVIEGEAIPPFDPMFDANTLQGHPASDFAKAEDVAVAINPLQKAALYQQIGKYTKHTVNIGDANVGTIIPLNVDGISKDFIIVHQGKPSALYDDSCNGTWLLMKDVYYTQKAWNSQTGPNNSYKGSTIHMQLNSDFLQLLDSDIKEQIKTVKIPYVNGTGGSAVASGANGLSTQVFLLSGYEVGLTSSLDVNIPVDGAQLSYFISGNSTTANAKRIAYNNGATNTWWLRSVPSGVNGAWLITTTGGYMSDTYSNWQGIRPAFVLPPDSMQITYYTDELDNIYTEQEYIEAITDISGNIVMQLPSAKIAMGSYDGTDTYGSSNPNSLTFDFKPKYWGIVCVYTNSSIYVGARPFLIPFINTNSLQWNPPGMSESGGTYPITQTVSGNTVTWYSTSGALHQANETGHKYYWIAIG